MLPIAHYENSYHIADTGWVLNLATNRLLKPITNPNGHLKISLANGDGTSKQIAIHRLVAAHYLPNPYNHTQINHKDGDKTHNHKDNLEWCSPTQNAQHALKTGLRPGYMSANDKELYLQDVLSGKQIKDLAGEINRHPSYITKTLRDTAKRLNLYDEWLLVMKENRKNAAIRNLEKNNYNRA